MLNTGIFGGNVLPCACADLALQAEFSGSAEPDKLQLQLIFVKPVDPASVADLNFSFQAHGCVRWGPAESCRPV